MGALIDTSILIAAERGQLDVKALLTEHAYENFGLSAITATELLHGVHRAKTAALHSRREAFVEGLLAQLPILPFDLIAARIHARVWAQLATQGITIGAHDLLIAATALAIDWQVVTRDERSFPKIPGLSVIKW